MSRSQQLKKQIAELSGMIESFRTGRYNPDAWAGADMRRGREADRDFRNQERNVGLEHEKNNIQISINGKAWKVIPGKGYADSREEREYLNNMKKWAERKSAATNKQWTVYLTGANPSNESMSEGGEIDKSHGSPYDRGAADSWYNRRYNPHKVVDGKEIPCETPEEKMAYSQGWKDNEDAGGHKDYREGVAEGWKGGAIGGAVSALAGPEAIPVGMAVGDKVGDWVGGKDMDEGAMDELHADLSDKYNELAPSIEKYKDEKGADHLYKELLAIARQHGAEREFSRMCNGARNRAHMDYDTNPGHFKNWFWYLGLGDKQGSMNENINEWKKSTKTPVRPRNFVAKNATTSGAGAHKDKKKDAKQGKTKHKKPAEVDERYANSLNRTLEVIETYGKRWDSKRQIWK